MRGEYFLVLGLILLFPLILSRDPKLGITRHRAALLKAIALVCVPFWIWDVIATARGHWSWNERYVAGIVILGMPVEEWLFFIVIAFVSIFTWESTKFFTGGKK